MAARGLYGVIGTLAAMFVGACALAIGLDPPSFVDGGAGGDAPADDGPGDDGFAPPPPGDDAGDADAPFFDAPAACDGATAFGAPVPITELNMAGANDVTATLSPDENTVYFASDRPGHIGGASIYVATRATRMTTFGTPALVPNVNDPNGVVLNPAITGDGLRLYLQATFPGVNPHLYVATRASTVTPFAVPVPVGNVNSAADDFLPTISLDGKLLAFSSNRVNVQAFVLYQAVLSGGAFGAPTAIPGIGTGAVPSMDTDPVMTADGLTLYFASMREDTSYHIYVAHRPSTATAFATPTRVTELDSPIGGGTGELPNWLSPDGCRMYLTRGAATANLYLASRPPN
jgi:Tol biopolymer transport system component